LTFLFWASSAQQIRYLIPLLPFLAIITGAILTHYRDRKRTFALLVCIVTAGISFNFYHIFREYIKISPLRAAVGIESREAFLARTLPQYPSYQYLNLHLPPNSRVFLLYMKNFTFLCDRDCYADSMFEAHTLQKILQQESSVYGVYRRLNALGFTHLLYDGFFLLGELSPLSEGQKRLFIDFQNRYMHPIRQEGTYQLYHLPKPFPP
jgi:hypothetical protein